MFAGGKGVGVSLDYRRPEPPTDKADKTYEMSIDGALGVEIAKALKVSKSRVTALLNEAHAARGEGDLSVVHRELTSAEHHVSD